MSRPQHVHDTGVLCPLNRVRRFFDAATKKNINYIVALELNTGTSVAYFILFKNSVLYLK
jgi:hypothetical protein